MIEYSIQLVVRAVRVRAVRVRAVRPVIFWFVVEFELAYLADF
jgi:hypothetical protein